jgi:hypothetical protein
MDITVRLQYHKVINEICQLPWQSLSSQDLISVAWAYYYFSIQFRENLEIARALHPDDANLAVLEREECNTDNLSPWPGVAADGEKMNHDEYMRRALQLHSIDPDAQQSFAVAGQHYLARIRQCDDVARSLSIASYEDGGLEQLFRAILTCAHWDNALLRAFQHFLSEHVRFDSDPDQGHGALSRHMQPDDRVVPLWQAFKDMLIVCVPKLAVRPPA